MHCKSQVKDVLWLWLWLCGCGLRSWLWSAIVVVVVDVIAVVIIGSWLSQCGRLGHWDTARGQGQGHGSRVFKGMYKDHPRSDLSRLPSMARAGIVAGVIILAMTGLAFIALPSSPPTPPTSSPSTPAPAPPQVDTRRAAQNAFEALHPKLINSPSPSPSPTSSTVAKGDLNENALAPLAAQVAALKAEVEALKSQLAAATSPSPTLTRTSTPPVASSSVKGENKERQEAVVRAFEHAWKGYKNHAWGKDELRPRSKTWQKWANVGLTLVDAIDTAVLMGLEEVYGEATEWVASSLEFEYRDRYNVFEVTIRILGSLLSSHALTGEEVFATKAIELGNKLMPAFQTQSGIPYSDIIPASGVASSPDGGMSSLAEVTTIQLEFNRLSDISGDPKFADAAARVMRVVLDQPSTQGLLGTRISPTAGRIGNNNLKLGARGDSYYEYLLKQYVQAGPGRDGDELASACFARYLEAVDGIKARLWRRTADREDGLWYVGEELNGRFSPKMDHLVCFLPGTLGLGTLYGAPAWHLEMAEQLMATCVQMYKTTASGLAPEIAYFVDSPSVGGDHISIHGGDRHNLLRPETVESLWYLHEITGSGVYADWGWEIFSAFEKWSKVETGGYTCIADVTRVPVSQPAPNSRYDKMESFFLSETLKYFWLLFDDGSGDLLHSWVLNTEGHPLPQRKS